MLAPAAGLLLAALLLGLAPGLTGRARTAAVQFSDHRGYAAAVLDGVTAPAPAAAGPAVHLPEALPPAVLTVALAAALAALPVRRPRTRGRRRKAAWRGVAHATIALRRLHSGQVGDSIAWLVVGTAGLGALLTAVLR
jgi:multicomponent Na+:H+ antiporter subunit D